MRKINNLLITAAAVLALTTVGCGGNIFENVADDSSREAQEEAARIALDEGNYDDAIENLEVLLEENPGDYDLTKELASAYMGRAGLDAIELMDAASQLADSAGSGDAAESLKMFSELFTFEAEQGADMHEAVDLLSNLEGRSEADNLYLAIAATADLVLTTGINITEGFDADGRPVGDIPDAADIVNMCDQTLPDAPEDCADNPDASALTRISEDLNLMVDGIAGSGLIDSEEVVANIEDIRTGIDADGEGGVDGEELQNYLTGL